MDNQMSKSATVTAGALGRRTGADKSVFGAEAANFQVEILVVPWLWSL